MKITCLIVDDEINNVEILQEHVYKYAPNLKIIGTALQVDSAKVIIENEQPDLIFLDIQMPNKNGFDLLRELDVVNFEIIFVTAFDQFGIQAIKFSALDYLLKPINVSEFIYAVNKAEKRILDKNQNKNIDNLLLNIKNAENSKDPSIALPTLYEIRYVKTTEIIRCQADNNYTMIWLKNGEELLVSKTLKEYDDLLSPYQFIRTHQSHLINKNYIKSWLKEDGGTMLLQDNTKIPISRQRKERIKKQLVNL